MNFFTVGFLLANFQLNAGWATGYFIKLVGAMFMLGGVAEISGFEPKARSLWTVCGMLAFLSAASGATMLLVSGKTTVIARGTCVLDAMVTTGLAAIAYRNLFAMLKSNPSLVGDEPQVKRCSKGYDRMLFVMALALLADCVNRFTSGTAADVSGFIMAVSRIVSYVMLIAGTWGFNRMRVHFNDAHPVE